MARRLPVLAACAVALAWVPAATAAPVVPLSPDAVLEAIAPPDPAMPDRSLEGTRRDLAATSAQLARARSAADAGEPGAAARLARLERQLEGRKRGLLAREGALARRDVVRTQAEADSAPAPAVAVYAPPPVDVALAGAPVPGTLSADEVAPAPIDPALVAAIDAYLAQRGSPLAGLGATFAARAAAVGLDPRLLVAIAGSETAFGTHGPAQGIQNPFGLGPGIAYPSWADAIAAAARTLGGQLYRGVGLVTIAQISTRWAPVGAANDPTGLNVNWTANVSRFYAELGGDPAAPVFTDASVRGQAALAVALGVPGALNGGVAAPAPYAVTGLGSGVGPLAAQAALRFLGMPYLWGGERPETGFDCSGLVQYVYAQLGVTVPRVAEDQARAGVAVPPSEVRAGDAVYFADAKGYIHHIGLYLGEGMFVHSPHTGDVIKVSSVREPAYSRQYAGARRY